MSTTAVMAALAPNHLVAAPYRRLLAQAVTRWVKHSGFAWTADRCKTMVQWLLHLRAGKQEPAPAWFSRSRYVAYAERVAKLGSFRQFSQLVQSWRVYTLLGEGAPLTEDAVRKFERMVTAPPTGELTWDWRSPFGRLRLHQVTRGRWKSARRVLPEVVLPPCVPVRNPLCIRTTDDRGRPSLHWEALVRDSWAIQNVWARLGIPPERRPWALRQVTPINVMLSGENLRKLPMNGTFGWVHVRVQRDGKARFFFAPNAWLQFLLGPWARELYRALQRLPQDCTFDQEKGARQVQQWLVEGREVYSFDLTSATDRFPLAFIRDTLLALSPTRNMRMWVETFCVVARLPASVSYRFASAQWITWTVGQPLGTIPSFAAFALAHHALVRGCWDGDPREAPYVLLGDDIVIADEELAARYEAAMRRVGVEISKSKSLTGRVGEFAGRVIESGGFEFKLKFFPVTFRTLPALISLIGPRALKAVPSTKLRNVIALLPTPRTPEGINPGGFPRQKVDAFLREYYALEKDSDISGELLVDPPRRVLARIAGIPELQGHPSRASVAAAPRGAASTGLVGEPVDGERSSPTSWKWSPWLSRAWLRRVRRAAKAAGLL